MTVKKLVVLIRPDNTALMPYADFAARDLISRGFEVHNQYENSDSIADNIIRKAADYIIGPDALDTIGHVRDAVESIANPGEVKWPLTFKPIAPDSQLPSKAHAEDAGYDLYLYDDIVVEPSGYALLQTGVSVELAPDEWGLINGRSSTLREFHLLVAPGVVDSGYHGDLMISVQNLSPVNHVALCKGQRIAQFLLMPNLGYGREPGWSMNSSLSFGERGSKGFGSSGS